MIRNNPAAKPYYRLLAFGLLVIAVFQIARIVMHLNDFISGLGMGEGLGFEIFAFYKIRQLKKKLSK